MARLYDDEENYLTKMKEKEEKICKIEKKYFDV